MGITDAMKRAAGAALLSGFATAAAVGLGGGIAHATNGSGEVAIDPWGNYEWCPGDPIMQSDNRVDWDWHACHTWHYQSVRDGAPTPFWVVEGLQEPWCQLLC